MKDLTFHVDDLQPSDQELPLGSSVTYTLPFVNEKNGIWSSRRGDLQTPKISIYRINVQRGVIKCFIASRVTKPEENNQWSQVDNNFYQIRVLN